MATETPYGVHSEVGALRKVLVCAPGRAHERLTPSNCDSLLFDDVLWVQNAKRDHFDFMTKMRERGIEVVGREMTGKGVRQAEPGGELRAEQARAEQPHFDLGAKARRGGDRQVDVASQQGAQFDHIVGEILGGAMQVLAQRLGVIVGVAGSDEFRRVGERRVVRIDRDHGEQGYDRPVRG